MAEAEFRYTMTITIDIKGKSKMEAIRDTVVTALTNAKAAGNIEEANWDVSGTIVREGGKI